MAVLARSGYGGTEALSPIYGLSADERSLLVARVVWTSPAQADAASYLNDMHELGIQDFDGGDAALLQVGRELLTARRGR